MQANLKTFSLSTLLAVLVLACAVAFAQSGTCSGMSVGQGANLNGFVPFQSSSLWNTDISVAPVDANSSNIINFIGATVTLHPDFGAGTFHNQTIGIPYQVIAGTQAKVGLLSELAELKDPRPALKELALRGFVRLYGEIVEMPSPAVRDVIYHRIPSERRWMSVMALTRMAVAMPGKPGTPAAPGR